MRRLFTPFALCLSLVLASFLLETVSAPTVAPASAQTRSAPAADPAKPGPPTDSFSIRLNDWNRGMNAADQYVKGKQQTNDRTEKFKSNLLRIRSDAVDARDQAQAAATPASHFGTYRDFPI